MAVVELIRHDKSEGKHLGSGAREPHDVKWMPDLHQRACSGLNHHARGKRTDALSGNIAEKTVLQTAPKHAMPHPDLNPTDGFKVQSTHLATSRCSTST
jgi:hypothetical protein